MFHHGSGATSFILNRFILMFNAVEKFPFIAASLTNYQRFVVAFISKVQRRTQRSIC